MKIYKLEPSQHQLGLTAQSFALTAYQWAKELKESTNQGDPDYDLKASIIDGNYGAAYVQIDGIRENYAAFSSLNFEEEFRIVEPPNNIVGLSDSREFEVKFVNRKNEENSVENDEFFPRYYDSEAKILEKIYEDLILNDVNNEIKGVIHIYTEREPCISCEWVTKQFMNKFPNIEVYYYYIKSISVNRSKRRAQNHDQLK